LENNDPSKPKVLPGAFFFLLGTIVAATLFPMPIARYAVECLSLADPIAAWVGQSISSPKLLPNQSTASVAGSLACFATSWLLGYFMLIQWAERGDDDAPIAISIPCVTLSALACCLAEALPIINDNLSIPIVTALAVDMSRSWI
jgi:dolichol kinase